MALLTSAELKQYARITTAAEDVLITRLISYAVALLETLLGAPLTNRPFGTDQGSWPLARSVRSGNDGGTVASGVLPTTPIILHSDYATRIEPLVNDLLQDLVMEAYDHRNPGRSAESSGGLSVQWFEGLPPRFKAKLAVIHRELRRRSS